MENNIDVQVSYEEIVKALRERLAVEVQNGLMVQITIEKLKDMVSEKDKEIERLQKIISKYEAKPKEIKEK